MGANNPATVRQWRSTHQEKVHAQYLRYQAAHPGRAQAAAALRYARKREWLEGLKAHPCMDCGGTFPRECMDFDHRPGEVKLFNISGKGQGMAQARVELEIAKCDLVCSNCHRIRTRKRYEDGTAQA